MGRREGEGAEGRRDCPPAATHGSKNRRRSEASSRPRDARRVKPRRRAVNGTCRRRSGPRRGRGSKNRHAGA